MGRCLAIEGIDFNQMPSTEYGMELKNDDSNCKIEVDLQFIEEIHKLAAISLNPIYECIFTIADKDAYVTFRENDTPLFGIYKKADFR